MQAKEKDKTRGGINAALGKRSFRQVLTAEECDGIKATAAPRMEKSGVVCAWEPEVHVFSLYGSD